MFISLAPQALFSIVVIALTYYLPAAPTDYLPVNDSARNCT
jgi:hypothetical protein